MNNAASVFQEILERDRRGEYPDWEDLDDALWTAVCDLYIPVPSDGQIDAVTLYFATRVLEGEVGNGGFAQAAMNVPEWFETAAQSYEMLDRPTLAAFVREAAEAERLERERIDAALDGGLEDAFAYFREGTFQAFDDRLEEVGWWENGEVRLAYARTQLNSGPQQA